MVFFAQEVKNVYFVHATTNGDENCHIQTPSSQLHKICYLKFLIQQINQVP